MFNHVVFNDFIKLELNYFTNKNVTENKSIDNGEILSATSKDLLANIR